MKLLSGLGGFARAFLLVPTGRLVMLVVWWHGKVKRKAVAANGFSKVPRGCETCAQCLKDWNYLEFSDDLVNGKRP